MISKWKRPKTYPVDGVVYSFGGPSALIPLKPFRDTHNGEGNAFDLDGLAEDVRSPAVAAPQIAVIKHGHLHRRRRSHILHRLGVSGGRFQGRCQRNVVPDLVLCAQAPLSIEVSSPEALAEEPSDRAHSAFLS